MCRSPEISFQDFEKPVEQQAPSVVFLPIGILQLGSYLSHNADSEVDYLDLHEIMHKKPHHKYIKILKKEIEKTLNEFQPDIIALSCTLNVYHAMFHKTAKIFRKLNKNLIIVGGGHYPSSYPERVSKDVNIDYVIVGEGEIPFTNLIHNFPKEKIIDTKQYLPNFIDFPLLDYEKIGLEKYVHGTGLGVNDAKTISIVSSRGCPNHCIYCATHNVWDHNFRPRNPEQMVEEIEFLYSQHGITRFLYVEDNFMINKRRVREFCNLLIVKNLPIEWYPTSVQINSLDCNIIKLMAKSGCKKLNIAIESGTERIQKLINKRVKLEMVPKLVDCIKKSNMKCECLLIFGFPSETLKEMQETIKFVEKLNCDWYQMGIATPLKGTTMYEMCESYMPIHEIDRINGFRSPMIETPEFTKEQVSEILYDANYRLNFLNNSNFVNGKYSEAEIYFKNVADRYPTHFIVRYILYKIYNITNQNEKMIQLLSEMRDIYRQEPEKTQKLIEKYNLTYD